jgi:D-amino peptidase
VKIYVMTDLEGVACVSQWSQVNFPDNVNKAAAMKLLTGEVNAAARGIFRRYPDAAVHVADGHGLLGMDCADLDPRLKYFCGRSPNRFMGLDRSYDAMFYVGQHAMAGTPGAPLCHTYDSSTVEHYSLNGRRVGEFGCRAFLAGSIGVPVVFLSGDDKACREARRLVPSIITATVKQGLGSAREWSLSLSPSASQHLIEKAAEEAAVRIPSIRPLRLKGPYLLEIRFKPRIRALPEVYRRIIHRSVKISPARPRAWQFRATRLEHLPL